MFTRDPRSEQLLTAHLQHLEQLLAIIPELTAEGATALLGLARIGALVHPYEKASGWVLEVRKPGSDPALDPRWTPRSWSQYCAGHHEANDLEHLCMCDACQHARHAAAWAAYLERKGGAE